MFPVGIEQLTREEPGRTIRHVQDLGRPHRLDPRRPGPGGRPAGAVSRRVRRPNRAVGRWSGTRGRPGQTRRMRPSGRPGAGWGVPGRGRPIGSRPAGRVVAGVAAGSRLDRAARGACRGRRSSRFIGGPDRRAAGCPHATRFAGRAAAGRQHRQHSGRQSRVALSSHHRSHPPQASVDDAAAAGHAVARGHGRGRHRREPWLRWSPDLRPLRSDGDRRRDHCAPRRVRRRGARHGGPASARRRHHRPLEPDDGPHRSHWRVSSGRPGPRS